MVGRFFWGGVFFWLTTCLLPAAAGQPEYSNAVRRYIRVDAPVVALVGASVVDGTGTPVRRNQTLVIREGRIAAVGAAGDVAIPAGAQTVDVSEHTITPGIVGMHDHTYYGDSRLLDYSAPRLYLGAGVTTIRTVGSAAPYAEIRLAGQIDRGIIPGPRIVASGPYITGEGGSAGMTHPQNEAHLRRVVRYWADEGVTWMKAYRHIARADLAIMVDEAHKLGVKVTAHLCSVTFEEAAELGIDNLEHGFIASTDFVRDKKRDACPRNARSVLRSVDIESEAVDALIRTLVDAGVAITSTLSIFETSFAHRPPPDPRALEMLAPDALEANTAYRQRIRDAGSEWAYQGPMLEKAMRFEYAFAKAGGLLVAGVDPGRHNLPGFGDLRNYELFLEAGFAPSEAMQIMTLNGARLLGMDDEIGTIEVGKRADLAVFAGDIVADPSRIMDVVMVFKDGTGYDSAKLFEDAKGMVGVR